LETLRVFKSCGIGGKFYKLGVILVFMANPGQFYVDDARVDYMGDGLHFTFNYPATKKVIERALPEAPQFGIDFFNTLALEHGAELGTPEVPTRPSSAGSIYQFADDMVMIHRRDLKAPVHPMYHSCCSGYPEAGETVLETQVRETAEENLVLLGNDQIVTDVVVPEDTALQTLRTVERLGLRLPTKLYDVQTIGGPDTFAIYDDGKLIDEGMGYIDIFFEGSRGHNVMAVRRFTDLQSQDVFPFDSEGAVNEGKSFFHFKRESYLIHPNDELEIGKPMKQIRKFQAEVGQYGQISIIQENNNLEPQLGPDKVRVKHSDIWYPDGQLVRVLAGLGFKNLEHNWREIERSRCEAKLEGKTLIHPDYLA
jgi:hypothetical protein